jgi:hypothetical protein
MEKKIETINEYFELVNLKAFCERYVLNYEFTRQVLNGKRPVTENFIHNLTQCMAFYQEMQSRIFKTFQ